MEARGDTPQVWSALPSLVPLVDLRQSLPPHVVAVADRTGAAVVAVGHGKAELTRTGAAVVAVGHGKAELKVQAGGWSQRRYQERAENVWEHNATEVADVRAVALLQEVRPDEAAEDSRLGDGVGGLLRWT